MSLTSRVTAPKRPTLSLIAEEPITALAISLEPVPSSDGQLSAESLPQSFKERKLDAGQNVVFPLGSGKAGTTHWRGMIQCEAAGKLWKREVNLTTLVTRNLEIRFDPNYYSSHLSLEGHYVEVQLSAPPSRGEISVYADDGTEIGSGTSVFSNEPANTWLRLAWTEQGQKNPGSALFRLAITLYDRDGDSTTLDLYPWAVVVPHEEVNFATASWEVAESERSKLDESLRKIAAVIARIEKTLQSSLGRSMAATPPMPKLYIAGHTDTVGSDSDNLTLSRNRARAIAAYLRQHGLKLPIYFIGYGERQLRVKTADNSDEPRNRRVDYTLALEAPPPLAGQSWQKL